MEGTHIRTFYRLVKTNPPTIGDFLSHQARGIPLFKDKPEIRRIWSGVSVFSTAAQARRTARRYPHLGGYVAELQIPDAGSITYARTTDQPGHHTLWGDPTDLFECVVSIVPV